MLTARLLNSEAELNSFFEIEQIIYVPGNTIDIFIQLINRQRNIRWMAEDPSAEVKIFIENKDNPSIPFEFTATALSSFDRSIWKVSLTPAQSLVLGGSNIQIEFDELGNDTQVFKTVLRNVLVRTILSGDC